MGSSSVGEFPASSRYARGSGSIGERERRVTIAREVFCFSRWKWVYDIPTLPFPASFPPSLFKDSYCIFLRLFFSSLVSE